MYCARDELYYDVNNIVIYYIITFDNCLIVLAR
jgi:hypothetical protein